MVAMSGGVDSSVAAGLLKRSGYDVIGVTFRLRRCDDEGGVSWCCGRGAEEQALAAAGALGIRHYVIDCAGEFERTVLRPAWDEYDRGRTPSPCPVCNRRIKFEQLMRLKRELGADRVATGHYARIVDKGDGPAPRLYRGVDSSKDQSYFLFGLTGEQLGACVFPLGEHLKSEVRVIAREMGLGNADRKESQDACLTYAEGGFSEALRIRFDAAARAGVFVDRDGNTIGEHGGIHRFTVGQRKGVGVAFGRRAYVARIDGESARVVLSDEVEDLESGVLYASNAVWTGDIQPDLPLTCKAQIRYRHTAAGAVAEPASDGRLKVIFDRPQRAVAPGQAVVLYSGDRVIGGAWIDVGEGLGER